MKDKIVLPELIGESSELPSNKVLRGTFIKIALVYTFDSVINRLLDLTGQDFEIMNKRHANIELDQKCPFHYLSCSTW